MRTKVFPAGNEVVEHVKTFVEVRLKKSASERSGECAFASVNYATIALKTR
jgi:hypothetical protein